MPNDYHNLLSGSDLHPNKIDATTGTELTLPSQVIYDSRWARQIRAINTQSPLTGGGSLAGDLSLSLPASTTTQSGYLSATDWTTFNGKQPRTFITVGPSGSTGSDYTGNGTTDQTAIQAANDSLTNGGTIILKKGSYITTAPVSLSSNVILIGEGFGATNITSSMAGSNLRGIVTISNKNNVTIQGIGFSANGSSTAFTSYGHSYLTIRDCSFTGTSTTANAGILSLCGQSSAGGVANMTDTLIDHCAFYDITTLNARTIHIYPRDGHIVKRTSITNCSFNNVAGPAISLDVYDVCRGTIVRGNTFTNLRQGTVPGGISDATAVFGGISTGNMVYDTIIEGNYYFNDNASITEGGLAYIYQSFNTVITGNICIGAWTSAYTVQGPCFAPGRTANPDYGLIITNNYVEGFNAFWDPDSMSGVVVSGNTVVRCGGAITTGYATQQYMNIHGNVFYNCIGSTSGYPAAMVMGNSNIKKSRIADNLIIDDRATPAIIYFVMLTGKLQF